MHARQAAPVIGLVFLAICAGSRARAEFIVGNKLYENCSKQHDIMCLSYIGGVIDAMRLEWELRKSVCANENVKFAQTYHIVANYLRDNPETRHLSGDTLVLSAMHRAYPCPK